MAPLEWYVSENKLLRQREKEEAAVSVLCFCWCPEHMAGYCMIQNAGPDGPSLI